MSRRYLAADGTPPRLGPHGRACDRCGWSRVRLRVRWPTDVGAGWAIAAVWITTVVFLATAAGSIEQRLDGEQQGRPGSHRVGRFAPLSTQSALLRGIVLRPGFATLRARRTSVSSTR